MTQPPPATTKAVQPVLLEYTLRLRGIRLQGHVGASREERTTPQEIIVDVDLTLPVQALPTKDRLREVVDYDAVACQVVEEGGAQPYRLLETYVAGVVERLLRETPATHARVSATKRRVPTKYPVDTAAVEIVGHRS